MGELKLYLFDAKDSHYDCNEAGVILATSEEKAWEIFFKENPSCMYDEDYYKKENWTVKEKPMVEGFTFWNFYDA